MQVLEDAFLELAVGNFGGFEIFSICDAGFLPYTTIKGGFCQNVFGEFASMEGASIEESPLEIDTIESRSIKEACFPFGIAAIDGMNGHGTDLCSLKARGIEGFGFVADKFVKERFVRSLNCLDQVFLAHS
jgi:hypothetical protein